MCKEEKIRTNEDMDKEKLRKDLIELYLMLGDKS